jgi:hypothetical protein
MRKTFILALAVSTSAVAAIVPSWRVNTISASATAADPDLIGAHCVSLMVTLSGGSQYNVSGLNISPLTFGGLPVSIYNTPAGEFGSDFAPNPAFFAIFPQVEYDTYVTTTNGASGSAAAVPGTYSGAPGPAVFGPDRFDVSWGATPNTGTTGTFEIARITFRGLANTIQPNVIVPGEVRSSDQPNVAVPLPPIPLPIPEPAELGVAVLLGSVMMRRRA